MKTFFLRHGNTFGDDQPGGSRMFMSGSKNNIPLVTTGRQQARDFAKNLDSQGIIPKALYANHLIRTWEMAVVIREYFLATHNVEIPLLQSELLLELDYGTWSGLTTENDNNEVINKFGEAGQKAWDDWQDKRIIPNQAPHNWVVTREEIEANVQKFADMLTETYSDDDVVVAIGSQGSLTYLNVLLEGGMDSAIAEDRYKVKTGRYCEFECSGDGGNGDKNWVSHGWNVKS